MLFRGHSARCTINTIACLIEFALTVDYALSTCGSLVVATVGLLAQLSSGLVCYMLELAGHPGPMGFGVVAWLVCGLSRALLFVSLSGAGFAAHVHVRPPALALSAACCYATAALHLYAMIGQVSTYTYCTFILNGVVKDIWKSVRLERNFVTESPWNHVFVIIIFMVNHDYEHITIWHNNIYHIILIYGQCDLILKKNLKTWSSSPLPLSSLPTIWNRSL